MITTLRGPIIGENITSPADFHFGVYAADRSQRFAITQISYAPETDSVTLTWKSHPRVTYIAKASTDMTNWGTDIGDSLTAEADENTDDTDHLTVTSDLAEPSFADERKVFFRIEASDSVD